MNINVLIQLAEELASRLWALSWEIGVLVALIAIISILSRRASAAFRYCLWGIVLVRLCIPIGLTFPVGLTDSVRQTVESRLSPVPAATPVAPATPVAASPQANALQAPEPDAPLPSGLAYLPSGTLLSWKALAGFAWLGLVSLGLAFLAARSIIARCRLRTLPGVDRPELTARLSDLCKQMGISKPVSLRRGDVLLGAPAPLVVGAFRPTVVLPDRMALEWPLEDLQPVLMHELAHVRRHDLLVNWLQMLVQLVYFFHPLVWFANSRMRREREWACDDVSIEHIGGSSAEYSRSILRVVEESRRGFAWTTMGVGMAENRRSIRYRIRRVLSATYRTPVRMGMSAVALLLTIGIASIVLVGQGAKPDPSTTGSASVSPAGGNAYELAREVFDPKRNLDQRREALARVREYTHYTYPGGEKAAASKLNQGPYGAVAPSGVQAAGQKQVSEFLEYQVFVKALRIQATMMLLQGRRAEALRQLLDLREFAQLVADSNVLIVRLIGVASCAITNYGIEIHVLNACETPGDVEQVYLGLEKLKARTKPAPTLDELHKVLGIKETILGPKLATANLEETIVRHKQVEAKFELIRMAAAAWHRYLSTKTFPAAPAEFGPLMREPLPQDPYANPKAPLRFAPDPKTQDFLCYSVGPNAQDEKGMLEYDPTNGTVSAGDVIVRIPRERKYPFPAAGVRADSAADVKALFPNGLPADPFADTRGRSLGISNTKPVLIYSFGPDTNQAEADKKGPAETYVPRIPYDPTNGTTSAGDLFIELPPK